MEDIHGVDVSWIHHSQHKDRPPRPSIQRSKSKDETTTTNGTFPTLQESLPQPTTTNGLSRSVTAPEHPSDVVATPPDTPTHTPTHTPTKRGGILRRSSSKEKVAGQNGAQNDGTRSSPKKSSWITSLSSKLSSVQSFPQPQATNVNANGQMAQSHGTSTLQRTPSPNAQHKATVGEGNKPYVPQQPRSGGNGFFSNALRRLSSSSQLAPSKMSPSGGVCPRKVMNIDPNRQRCLLPELECAKLRRVAFCVDVEIAGGPRYKDDEPEQKQSEHNAEKKIKEKAEGEALKNPDAMIEEKERADPDGVKPDAPTPVEQQPPKKEMTRKKEKKKKSEEERKERKEQKRRKAEESGSIPMVITRSLEDDHDQNASTAKPPPRPLDRPTIDPLRIYRRCCQLRETPILKRITDQLASLQECAVKDPGVVFCLDLTGSRLQLADVVTLSDWLAIVPVRKLILEDADLNDEGVRVILAGLLAAITPEFSRKRRSSMIEKYEERSGLVEKLSLKNNAKITKEGWRHICLFLYMCKSIRSLDVSGNTFPPSPTEGDHHLDLQHAEKAPCDPADTFAKALSERLGGSRFEELVMGECGLSANQIRKIVDAVAISGIKRLGLAGNGIGQQALEYIVHYVRSGVCEGLDLGSNDLHDHLDVLGEAFEPNCRLWALSLADCKLDPTALKPLFPGLLNLQNLRFLDLSHNPELFDKKPSALGLLQKYLPMMRELRRIHLNNNDMAPNQAIALADVITECSELAHLSILGNPKLSALASAKTEENQEEAVALYASLMAAARVSPSIISIEIDVPTADNSEIVKALAKQLVAYCIRNMERWSISDTASLSSGESASETNGDSSFTSGSWGMKFPQVRESCEVKEVDVPEVLVHLVGNVEGSALSPNADEPAPDNDYIVGGTGVVKALNYCLAEFRRGSTSMPQSGAVTPLNHPAIGAKAKAMSKDLLESARKIRTRLQPALLKESKGSDHMAYRRLLFLDSTLSGIITRFEHEYPETRLVTTQASDNEIATTISRTSSASSATAIADESPTTAGASMSPSTEGDPTSLASSALHSSQHSDTTAVVASDSDSDAGKPGRRRASRHASDVSLAAKAQAAEEGKVLRIGLELKRAQLDKTQADAHDTEDEYVSAPEDAVGDEDHVRKLRETLLALESRESGRGGPDEVVAG